MMGLFSKQTSSNKDLDLSLSNILILVLMVMVLVQAIGLIFSGSWGASIKLGPAFILVAVVMAAGLSIAVFKKMATGEEVTQKDVFAIILVVGIALALLFFLRDFIPEVFEPGVIELQSLLGI